MNPALAIILLVLELAVLSWLVFNFISGVVSAAHGAPYVPTEKNKLADLLRFAGLGPGDVFYDLGSGDGRVLRTAVRDFKVSHAVGYEIAPWPYWKSRWHMRRDGNVILYNRTMFDAGLQEATCVYAYLFPKLNDRLASKLAAELRSGALVLCPSFSIDLQKHPQFRLKKTDKIGTIVGYLYEKI